MNLSSATITGRRWNTTRTAGGLGRLAVARSIQNQRIGSLLLFDALKRACANEIAWAVFLVEAKNERSAVFYEKFRFRRFHHAPHSLWITRKEAESLIHA